MKISKILLLLVFTISILSCKNDDDGDTDVFNLSNENIAGTYSLTLFEVDLEETRDFNGIPVTSITSVVGDTFQVTASFDDDGTYSISGQYRVVITITVPGSGTTTDTEIILIDDNGTYQINDVDQTINFSALSDLGAGSFDVEVFNEFELKLVQMETETTPDLTSTGTSRINFERD